MPTALRYCEQYNRMNRWYQRFVALDQGRVHDTPSDNYLDEIHAFFLNCYHLKDWIKHDDALSSGVQAAVESYIDGNRWLRICADICNSLKHLRLKTNRSGEDPSFGPKLFALTLAPGQVTTISLKYDVQTNTGPIDSFRLATECVAAWKIFLKDNGLIVP